MRTLPLFLLVVAVVLVTAAPFGEKKATKSQVDGKPVFLIQVDGESVFFISS